jgi:predicted nucleic acid-binding protein
MILYVDTSALVKVFVDEVGSLWIRRVTDQAELVGTSALTYIETLSALARRQREKSLTAPSQHQAINQLSDRWSSCSVIPVTEQLIAVAAQLVLRYPLKAYDAIHLASAIELQTTVNRPITFAAFDDQLNRAAKKEKLRVLARSGQGGKSR